MKPFGILVGMWTLVFWGQFPPVDSDLPLLLSSDNRLYSVSFVNLFVYLFIFGCVGSSLLRPGFL